MTAKQEFRYQFLLRCAESGIDAAGAVKLAENHEKVALFDGLLKLPVEVAGLGLAAAAAGGAGAGLGLAHMQAKDLDPEAVKKRELIDAYQTYAAQLRASKPQRRIGARAYGGGR